MKIEEDVIIKLCQKGKLEEFAKLYDAYFPKIYRFVFYKTSHKETAEDITSQTFIKAMRKIEQFHQAKGTFQAWLFKIARNQVIDYYRAKKNLFNIEDVWGLGEHSDVSSKLDASQLFNQAKQYLQKLTSQQREIVILRVWEKMPYQEIAQIMEMTESACRMSFSRSIKSLRQELGGFLVLVLILILRAGFETLS